MEVSGVPGGFYGLDGNSFRSKVKELIKESGAPDLQSFCYWTLYHAFHLWNSDQGVFGKVKKGEIECEMSAAQCLVELKTQSEVVDTDFRKVSSDKSLHAELSSVVAPKLKAITKSESKDVCFSDRILVRRGGNGLFPLDDIVGLSSSELAQESASGSPLSVVFPWSPRIWIQGNSGSVEALDAEGIVTSHKQEYTTCEIPHTSTLDSSENEVDFHCRTSPHTEAEARQNHSTEEVHNSSPRVSLEVYLGDDLDVVGREPAPFPNSTADLAKLSRCEHGAEIGELGKPATDHNTVKNNISNQQSIEFEGPDMKDNQYERVTGRTYKRSKGTSKPQVNAKRVKYTKEHIRNGGERTIRHRRYKTLATLCL